MSRTEPKFKERDFSKLFPTARPWVHDVDKSTISEGNGARMWDRLIPVSPFMSVEPHEMSSLYVTHTQEVRDAAMRRLCDEDRDQMSFKAIPWPEGYAIWCTNHLISGHFLLAIVDPSTVPQIKRDTLKRYRCTFNGRRVGAIGIFHPCTMTVLATDIDAARLDVYREYEHLSGFHAVEVGR